jgi:hypothetical protein
MSEIKVDFYGEMTLLELVKHIIKWRKDPFHYNFHEALDLLIDVLQENGYKYAYNLARSIQKYFNDHNDIIKTDSLQKLKRIYYHLEKKEMK